MNYTVKHIKESSWIGRPKETIDWEFNSDEDFFLALLKENNKCRKRYRGTKESFEIVDCDLANKYESWWNKLTEEEKAKIYEES